MGTGSRSSSHYTLLGVWFGNNLLHDTNRDRRLFERFGKLVFANECDFLLASDYDCWTRSSLGEIAAERLYVRMRIYCKNSVDIRGAEKHIDG